MQMYHSGSPPHGGSTYCGYDVRRLRSSSLKLKLCFSIPALAFMYVFVVMVPLLLHYVKSFVSSFVGCMVVYVKY